MAITTLLSYAYNIPVTVVPTSSQASSWDTNLKANVDKLLANLQAIVPDATAYVQNIVTPAVQQWSAFVNPDYTSKKGEPAAAITNKMSAKMTGAADKYLNGVNKAFGNGGTQFKAAVDAKKDNWGDVQGAVTNYVLPVTGSRQTGFQAVPFTAYALTGDQKALRMLGTNLITGSITDIVTPGLESQFRAALTGLLVQMYQQYYFQLQTPAAINGKIIALVNPFVNSAVCNPFAYPAVPGSSGLYFAPGGGNKQLVCQIVTGTP